jgi:hypothetical protein
MKLRLSAGLAAGLIAISATPAMAANVTVRVEGASRTLVETATTTPATVVKDAHECAGATVAGALDGATGGNWAGAFDTGFGDFLISSIAGESPSGDDYWTLWVNHKSASKGACQTPVQDGDEVLFFVDTCHFDGAGCSNAPVLPLGLTAPASVTAGSSGVVTVVSYDFAGKPSPMAGASVGGATTDAEGHATIAFPTAGTVRLRAEKAGFARSETDTVAVTAPGAARPPAAPATPDRTPPAASLSGLKDHAIFKTGPRQLRGSFGADPSGIKAVKLRLTKGVRKACSYFSGRSERFKRTRCGTGAYFVIGDRADWSYLLPARLGAGRYVLDAVAIDGAGNRTPLARGTTRVVFTVR